MLGPPRHGGLKASRKTTHVAGGPSTPNPTALSARRSPLLAHECAIASSESGWQQGRCPSRHRQHGGIDRWHRPEYTGRYPLPEVEGPPRCPSGRQQGGGWDGGALAGHAPLDHEIRPRQRTVGIIEQAAQERRREPKRERPESPEGPAGKPVSECIDLEHPDVGGTAAIHCSTELTGQECVRLEGDDLVDLARQSNGATAQARPDLDDQVTRLERGLRDQCLGDLRLEEVLSETASSLVSWRPLDRGHGPSPRYPWGSLCPFVLGFVQTCAQRSGLAEPVGAPPCPGSAGSERRPLRGESRHQGKGRLSSRHPLAGESA